ncbi:hypothetical protein DMH02_009705 [Streptomyces sp. WAC 00631]|uniref:hypothetical protein n=1 Tax=unclassified Streptomyces TaxID=2593676 RepID=UPI001E313E29|nr:MULTISPECIES: hypothetical protein [unclassified Streptomyces]MCC5033483.1 hypothetical protein [Streptomyces sp. WAC 00631]MCC9741571.1 hypothetical protein [Streptomyces sp. MNU89]
MAGERDNPRAQHGDRRLEQKREKYGDLADLTVDELQQRAAKKGPAKWLSRKLDEPYETLIGSEQDHQILAVAHADCAFVPGSPISWEDMRRSAEQLPLPRKAALLLDMRGIARPVPEHLTGEKRSRAGRAGLVAERVSRRAHQLGVDL